MKAMQEHYTHDAPTTMQRALATGARLGWSVVYTDANLGLLTFNTGRSMRTWGGQNVSGTIASDGATGSWLTFNATAAAVGNPLGGGGPVMAFGEAKKMWKRFAREMARPI
jgi:hypothetical protein